MLISTVIPTVDRPELLARAVNSVLAQAADGLEVDVVVVNDSGKPLPYAQWQDDPAVQLVTTYRTERSVAFNTGIALARGAYVNILGDDDYLLPQAYLNLSQCASQTPGAALVYGAYEIRRGDTGETQVIQPQVRGDLFALLVGGEGIPLQACVLHKKSVLEAGGFDPTLAVAEDTDITNRVSYVGGVERTGHVCCCIRVEHSTTTSTDWGSRPRAHRLVREKAFSLPKARQRLSRSIFSQHTRGRIVRGYLGSAQYNLRQGAVLIGASRAICALRIGWRGILSKSFWRGVAVR